MNRKEDLRFVAVLDFWIFLAFLYFLCYCTFSERVFASPRSPVESVLTYISDRQAAALGFFDKQLAICCCVYKIICVILLMLGCYAYGDFVLGAEVIDYN